MMLAIHKSLICTALLSLAFPTKGLSDVDKAEVDKEYDCIGIVGETTEQTAEFQQDCRYLMATRIMKETRKHVRQASDDELKAAREDYFNSTRDDTIIRRKRSPKPCPVFDEEYLSQHEDIMDGLRSTSPYDSLLDFNPLRYPQYILQHHCLCEGCIDLRTKRETSDLSSYLVQAVARVFVRKRQKSPYRKVQLTLNVGCTCLVPVSATTL